MFKGKELTENLVKRESIDSLTRWPEKTKSFLFLSVDVCLRQRHPG